MRESLSQACSPRDLTAAGRSAFAVFVDVLKIPMLTVIVVGLAVGIAQSRGLFASHGFRFEFRRVLPSFGAGGRPSVWIAVLRALGMIAVVIGVSSWTMRQCLPGLAGLAGAPMGRMVVVMGTVVEDIGLRLGLATIAIGLADYCWQRVRHRQSLRMTRDEVKREQREREGDPTLKAARRQLRLEDLQRRALGEVRRASLVVVDQGRIAAALLYRPTHEQAPVVVLKGEFLMATRIEQIAREAEVPILCDRALAQALATVEEGCEIPESTHDAVARLLAAVRPASA
jgi:flagellar biosynthesis protein FlhB